MFKAYKYRIYPTKEQSELISKHFGACRFVYNLALEVKNYAYSTQRVRLSAFDLMSQLPELKKECVWLKEVDSQSLKQSILNLDRAFAQFFHGHASFPKFKNKHATQSFGNPNGSKVIIKDGKLYQPKFTKKGINIIIDRDIKGKIKNTVISRTSTGKYFVSIMVDNEIEFPIKSKIKECTSVGIDLGLKYFIVTSDGLTIEHPKHFKKSLSHLKYLSRQHSRKKKGGNNRKKSQLKLALQHEKITNQRKDFLHKLSTQLVKNHDTLCFETLRVGNMVKNKRISQAIQNSGWSMFLAMCKYKAAWNGKNILQIPTFEPSTKICSTCGHTIHSLTLADREWICANCNTLHDRDINAAINIKKYSLNNCGEVHRKKPVELPILIGALKQEITL